ncbi:hypothetical protein [Cognatilysobacter bugurensis]|uniref:Uncharacterized protein n=1 Tax=Cognatilysobacter bugurensis TaxID=543356 RepID=A0A918W9Z0_9GAMM|nr:hypothetical protein [Lysobacter bugurensis]GHA86839.1 hypothetical protein GCM10007067_25830 [Lysobacter bugurensis]
MNIPRPQTFVPATVRTPVALSPRPAERRERDFGVGYGRSSGYAAPRRYVTNAALPRFRFA